MENYKWLCNEVLKVRKANPQVNFTLLCHPADYPKLTKASLGMRIRLESIIEPGKVYLVQTQYLEDLFRRAEL